MTPNSPTDGCIGSSLTRPRAGLIPTRPVTLAGMRIDPPPSEPWATDARRADTAAAAPPLEPPADRSRSQGVRADLPQLVLGVRGQPELRGRGLAHDDESGGPHPGDEGGVGGRHMVGESAGTEGAGHTGDLVQVLHRRHTSEQRGRVRDLTGGQGGIKGGRLDERLIGRDMGVRADLGVELLDPPQVEPGQLGDRELARPDRAALLESSQRCQIGGHRISQSVPGVATTTAPPRRHPPRIIPTISTPSSATHNGVVAWKITKLIGTGSLLVTRKIPTRIARYGPAP